MKKLWQKLRECNKRTPLRPIPNSLGAPTKKRYDRLIKRVGKLTGIERDLLLAPTRGRGNVSHWRMVMWYVLRKEGATYQEIGDYFGRNHSAVIYGIKRIDSTLDHPKIKFIIEQLIEEPP